MTTNTSSPIYAFLEKPSLIDFPGHMCGVFFTSGCNFTCGFCHNATLMGKKQKTLSWERLDEVCRKFKDEWVDAVSISGGEPTLEPGLIDLLHFFRGHSFKVKLDTNGSRPGVIKECLPLIDYIAMDIKAGLSGYPEIAGFTRTEIIKESIGLIMSTDIEHEFRTTVIDPFHTDEQMLEAGGLIQGARRFVLQAFVPQDHLPGEEFRTMKRTKPERLNHLKDLLEHCADEVVIRGA